MNGPLVSVVQENNAILLKLEGPARVETAEVLHQQLLNVAPAQDVTVDWEQADYVDASVLQILLSLQQKLSQQGCTLSVAKDNPQVRHYLCLSGLSEHFPAPCRATDLTW